MAPIDLAKISCCDLRPGSEASSLLIPFFFFHWSWVEEGQSVSK